MVVEKKHCTGGRRSSFLFGESSQCVPSVVLVGGVRKGQYVSVGRHTADS